MKKKLQIAAKNMEKRRVKFLKAQNSYIFMRICAATKISKCWRRYAESSNRTKNLQGISANMIQRFVRALVTEKHVIETMEIERWRSMARRQFLKALEEMYLKMNNKDPTETGTNSLPLRKGESQNDDNYSEQRKFKRRETRTAIRINSKGKHVLSIMKISLSVDLDSR
mmetsp:Transcript_6153/g.7048  ORF Transcript_6153/g.7048 Transcript_6153/m.7048 type:complete len:169 (+) Transcript_6153:11-517(+)